MNDSPRIKVLQAINTLPLPGAFYAWQIEEATGMARQTVWRCLEWLVEDGYALSEPCGTAPGGGRIMRLYCLTQKGQQTFGHIT